MSFSYTIKLNKVGYDPFLDFLKGLCIVFVILTHCISPTIHKYTLFCLWGDMAVPLFLLIQVYQTYKKGTSKVVINVPKLMRRIVIPFIIVQILGMLILFLTGYSFSSALKQFGNIGPGAYYPYIYMEFALLLVILAPLFNRFNKGTIIILFLVISILFELLAIYVPIPPDVYRLLFFRYTFLIAFGWLLSTDRIVLTPMTIAFALIGGFAILVFDGIIIIGAFDWSKVFYADSFKQFHWISYLFVVYALLFAIKWFFKTNVNNIFRRFFMLCGKYSYEIFLFQMLFFLISPVNIIYNKIVGESIYWAPVAIIINVICCTLPVIIILKYRDRRKHSHVQSR